MFTSRAEYRILLRQDNADNRLTKLSYDIGLAEQERMDKVIIKEENVQKLKTNFSSISISPDEINPLLLLKDSAEISQKMKAGTLVLRPQLDIYDLKSNKKVSELLDLYNDDEIEQAEILLKYEGYIQKEEDMANKLLKIDNIKIRSDFDYSILKSLSTEAKQKLSKIKPTTLGQASRISGINPSDVSSILIYLDKR